MQPGTLAWAFAALMMLVLGRPVPTWFGVLGMVAIASTAAWAVESLLELMRDGRI